MCNVVQQRAGTNKKEHDEQDRLIVGAMIQLARGLKLTTVAEGIEDAGLVALLRDMGCDEAQGYFFAKPLPPAELEQWVARSAAPAERVS